MFKKIFTTAVGLIVLVLCGLIVLRCCMSADRSIMTDIIPSEALRNAYTSGALTAVTTEEPAADIADDGYYSVYGLVYFPELHQVQITVRYNRSLFSYVGKPEGTEFSYTLGEKDGSERISPTVVETYEKGIYIYRRLVFDGVDVEEETALYCFMRLSDTYESENPVHHAMQPLVNRKFTKAELQMLGSAE